MNKSNFCPCILAVFFSAITSFAKAQHAGTGTYNGAAISNNYSIYASGRMAASEFNAFSDARFKNINGITNNAEDLATLAKIEIINYTLKDSIAKGNNSHKKVIAKQVEKVYPQAVNKLTDVIPDIYKMAGMKDGKVMLPATLKHGEKVKLIYGNKEETLAVTDTGSSSFTVNSHYTGKVFVYGREVSDFRSVDYGTISMLNVPATEELLKKVTELEMHNSTLKAAINSMKTDMEKLETVLLNK
jgi:Chaperone of endosialidase